MGGVFGIMVASCRSPTQIVVEVRTDADCASIVSTSVTTARPEEDVEAKLPQATRAGCAGAGEIGSIVLVPRDAEDVEVKLRVTTGIGRGAEACPAPAYEGCVVVRRQLRFEPGETVRVTVNVPASCRDRPCGPDATCNESGVCVPLACPRPPCGTSPDAGPRCEDVCPGVCNAGRCELACTRAAPCRGTTCPPGIPCTFVCSGPDACVAIRCGDASACTVRCDAPSACRNGIRCDRAATCDVTCRAGADDACDGDIACPTAGGTCNVACNDECKGPVFCCDPTRATCRLDEPGRLVLGSSVCR